MDLPVNYRNISDEALVERDGTVTKYKRYDFFLGKHGPFTERVPLEPFDNQEITRRIGALRLHIEAIHR